MRMEINARITLKMATVMIIGTVSLIRALGRSTVL